MRQVREYLDEHYADSVLSLSTAAKVFYVNPSYLSRSFKKVYGMTLVEYLNNVRIEHACDYLREGGWKIYQVAEKVGIPNPDYFTKCFRKRMGISARAYGKSKNNAEEGKNSSLHILI